MDVARALTDLTEISSQIEAAVLLDGSGELAGSTLADEERARRIAGTATRLLEAAAEAPTGRSGETLAQLEAATPEGSVFAVRAGGRTIVATTASDPTTGLVLYDLKSCLRSLDEAPQAASEDKPKPKPRRKPKPKAKAEPKEQAAPKPRRSRASNEEPADGAA